MPFTLCISVDGWIRPRSDEASLRWLSIGGTPPLSPEIRGAMATHSILLIGVGNPYRQDDGAGIVVARRLRPLLPERVECVECTGDLVALMDAWQGYDLVIVIDAMHSGRSAGEVIRLDASEQPPPAHVRFASTHAVSLSETLALAHALNRMPPKVVVYGIEGKHFGEGEGLSAEVAKAVEDVVRYILQELREGNGDA